MHCKPSVRFTREGVVNDVSKTSTHRVQHMESCTNSSLDLITSANDHLQLAASRHIQQPKGCVEVQRLLVELKAACLGHQGRPELGRCCRKGCAERLHGPDFDHMLLLCMHEASNEDAVRQEGHRGLAGLQLLDRRGACMAETGKHDLSVHTWWAKVGQGHIGSHWRLKG